MNFEEKSGNLILTIDDDDRAILQLWKDEMGNEIGSPHRFESDDTMYEFFDDILGNSEFTWIGPEENGDLTDAPILGIYGEPERRYGFMDYAIVSMLERLLDTGKAVLQGAQIRTSPEKELTSDADVVS